LIRQVVDPSHEADANDSSLQHFAPTVFCFIVSSSNSLRNLRQGRLRSLCLGKIMQGHEESQSGPKRTSGFSRFD
jgi:hypothetical protein